MPEITAIRVEALIRDADAHLRLILGGTSVDGRPRSGLDDETVDAVLDRYIDDTNLHIRFRATAKLSDGRTVEADAGDMTQTGPSVAVSSDHPTLTAEVEAETRAWMEQSVREGIEERGISHGQDVLAGELARQGIEVSPGAARSAPVEFAIDEAGAALLDPPGHGLRR